jgi:CubicO group peptidase (beta-lactamase class C family)
MSYDDYQIPTRTDDGWETSSLVEEGVDSGRIADLMRSIHSGGLENIQGVLLVKNGKLVFEEYFDGYDRDIKHHVASVTKSIASVVIGIAIDQGFIDGMAQGGLDRSVLDLFPEYATVINADPAKRNLLFKHILSMSAGLEWDEQSYPYDDPRNDWYRANHGPDSVSFVLQKPVVVAPGTEFAYNGGLSILLSALIKNSSGMHTAEFAEGYLFGPLGIEDYAWDAVNDGLTDTDGGLHMRPRDMAKIGCLLLNGGRWKGNQIVSQAWVNESTRVHISTGMGPGYGYQWWRGKLFVSDQSIKTFFASGHGGQKIFMFPTLDLVVALTHQVFDNPFGDLRNVAMLTRHIIPATLPPVPPRGTSEPVSKDLDGFVGEYESTPDGDLLTIFMDGNELYLRGGEVDRAKLIPETEDRFMGTVMGVVDFQIVFFKDERGEVEHLTLYLGFRSDRYDKRIC